MLPALLPKLNRNLAANGEAAWRDIEAAVLCLGVAAEACSIFLTNEIPGLMDFLVRNLSGCVPILGQSSGWAISQLASWVAAPEQVRLTCVVRWRHASVLPSHAAVAVRALAAFGVLFDALHVVRIRLAGRVRCFCDCSGAVPCSDAESIETVSNHGVRRRLELLKVVEHARNEIKPC